MTKVLSTNITSPLGMTTEQNYEAVKSGCSVLKRYEGKWNLQEPFAASLFTDEQMADMLVDGYTRFESVVLHSVREALTHVTLDVSSDRVVFILSTTKGNVELLGDEDAEDIEYPGAAAKRIATALGISTEPIVVCNACISGVAAQILAQRLLDSGKYDYAIVAGGEVQSKFVVSGFQAFKAVSDEICRPFDIERLGLNLGDGAATMIFGTQGTADDVVLEAGCVRNDAYHLSAPHPQGEGYLLALNEVLDEEDNLATLGVHGTATMYNDQMESKAIQRAGLSDVPLTSLKGYYGHTMGAAGVIETIITLCAMKDGLVLGARGFEEIGVSGKIDIKNETRVTEGKTLVKMLSGFGGCNGAVKYSIQKGKGERKSLDLPVVKSTHTVRITPQEVFVDGNRLSTETTGRAMLKELYKSYVGDYVKFYKMDALTRLTFVASELLLKAESDSMRNEANDASRAVILFNRTSSIVADKQYWQTIKSDEEFYPSPAAFLYTLPNLTTGEIAIRNHYMGETSFYILNEKHQAIIDEVVSVSFMDGKTTSIVCGWIDCEDDEVFTAELSLVCLDAN